MLEMNHQIIQLTEAPNTDTLVARWLHQQCPQGISAMNCIWLQIEHTHTNTYSITVHR